MEQQDSAPALRATHGWRAWMILIAMIALVDVTLYRSLGFAGPAVFFPGAVALLLWGRGRIEWNTSLIVVKSLLILLSASMIWAGGNGQIIAAVWLLIAANLSAQGLTPYSGVVVLAAITRPAALSRLVMVLSWSATKVSKLALPFLVGWPA